MNKIKYLFDRIKFLIKYPIHFSIIYLYAFIFGTLKQKIFCNIFRLPHYAYCVYIAALRAKQLNLKNVSVIEFGVANGRGLIAMGKYANFISKKLKININVYGFDSGSGMPENLNFKDHPELYVQGDFPMQDKNKLISILPENTQLILTDLNTNEWVNCIDLNAPIGFVSIDVDYYSSTIKILQCFKEINSNLILPNCLFYFDDIHLDNHNIKQGELLAINEFNNTTENRILDWYYVRLKNQFMFNNELWLIKIYQLQVLDHISRNSGYRNLDSNPQILPNKYLN